MWFIKFIKQESRKERNNFWHYVVPENIHTPRGGQRKFREEGKGSKRRQFPRGGGCLERFFPGSLSKIGELLIYNSFSVEQAISFLYRYWCFKTIIIVFIDHLLTTVG